MATIKRFEDLEVWKLAREIAQNIYLITKQENFTHEYKLKEQVKSSSGSAMDNCSPDFYRDGRGGRVEFIQFLSISKGSTEELKSQLYRILDYKLIAQNEFDNLYLKADILSAKIYSFMDYLNKSQQKGLKFKDRV
jgi:four helix bundle protein